MADKNLDAVRNRRSLIRNEIARLKSEDTELAIAEQVLLRLISGPAAERTDETFSRKPSTPAKRPRTQKDFVLAVLAESATPWMRSNEIMEAIQRNWAVEIPEKSLRPLLSFMKRDGIVVRQGRGIALVERLTERGVA